MNDPAGPAETEAKHGPGSCSSCQAALWPGSNYCSTCGHGVRETGECAVCHARVGLEDYFCYACGIQLREPEAAPAGAVEGEIAEGIVVAEVVPASLPELGRGITIELDVDVEEDAELLDYLAEQPGYARYGDTVHPTVRVRFPVAEVRRALDVVDRIGIRASRRVYRDGKRVQWEPFFGFADCFRARESSGDPVNHCFFDESNNPNLWGCYRSEMPFEPWLGSSNWMANGRFQPDGSFVFDKKKITLLLDRKLSAYRLCPALNLRYVSSALKALPPQVNPRKSKDWKYLEGATGNGSGKGGFAIKRRQGDEMVDVPVRGVLPSSGDAAVRIFEAIRKVIEMKWSGGGSGDAGPPAKASSG